ncbi:chlorhexidine efflux transporter [Pseudomonas phoenicis]|uniref:chlorhexidine efflux transporter n=1 Tax=unclassified Pseudomonas TaxID=196821 RepID=UPI0039A3AA88
MYHSPLRADYRNRILHGIGLEISIVALCLPIGMWTLEITLSEASLLEVGLFAFALPYTNFYNWSFEKIKRLFSRTLDTAPRIKHAPRSN